MCFYINLKDILKDIKKEYKVEIKPQATFKEESFVSGFTFPDTPLILDKNPKELISGEWGLIPIGSHNKEIQKYTLNGRIESLHSKPSFRNSLNNRCLILVKGFYEWQWLDGKGKEKQRYHITLEGQNIFSLGGIYSEWVDEQTGEIFTTYCQITTEANPLMSEIHNHKKRMPVVLSHNMEKEWLSANNIKDFSYPQYDPELIAKAS